MASKSGNKLGKKLPPEFVPNNGRGRPKGAVNAITALVKEAILEAACQSGYDKKGKDGLVGYCKRLADHHEKLFTPLLGKVMPTQLTGADGGPLNISIAKDDADLG